MRAVRVAVLCVALAVVAGCAQPPQRIEGRPAPVTPLPGSPGSPPGTTPGPRQPTGSPSPARPVVPVLPAAYDTLEFSSNGVTVRLPVPAGWTRRRTSRGYGYGDSSGTLVLRVEVTPRTAADARTGWEAYEPTVRRQLAGYRRLRVDDVAGVGESAVDWSFTFGGGSGPRRRAIDRLVVADLAGIAVYFSSLERDYDAMRPVWTTAVGGLLIS